MLESIHTAHFELQLRCCTSVGAQAPRVGIGRPEGLRRAAVAIMYMTNMGPPEFAQVAPRLAPNGSPGMGSS